MKYFPDEVGPLDETITMKSTKSLGVTAPIYVHELARQLPLYDEAVNSDAVGQDTEGNGIEINTLGRWLFGVPGYGGHTRIVSNGNQVSLSFPKKSPEEVYDFVFLLKRAVETAY